MNYKILSIKLLFVIAFLFIKTASFAQDTLATAPAFTLKDINGKNVSLSDFKGKVIYLDIWASWCGPCIKEIPHSRKLQKKFEGNSSIVFLNISFDHDSTRWKDAVEDRKVQGIQLISMRGADADIINAYNVKTIPRFIIINKEGKIVDKFAPPPSDKGIEAYLKEVIGL